MTTVEHAGRQAPGESKRRMYKMCRVGSLLWKLPESKTRPTMPVMTPADKEQVVDEICGALDKTHESLLCVSRISIRLLAVVGHSIPTGSELMKRAY